MNLAAGDEELEKLTVGRQPGLDRLQIDVVRALQLNQVRVAAL